METQVLYNIFQQEALGIKIAIYFYLTGLSAGSLVISSLAPVFGLKQFKPAAKTGAVLAAVLVAVAPLFLLAHISMPLRAWHLFFYLNPTSPLTWGSFLLVFYFACCVMYGYSLFRDKERPARVFGYAGIFLVVAVEWYTGSILSFGKARALWHTPLMPALFLVSACVSGTAVVIFISFLKERYFSKEKKINLELMMSLARIMAWLIVLDLFLLGCEMTVLSISHSEAQAAAELLLKGKFSFLFLVGENLAGKIIPFFLVVVPRFRRQITVVAASILVLAGIFIMRYVLVIGGEFIPLI